MRITRREHNRPRLRAALQIALFLTGLCLFVILLCAIGSRYYYVRERAEIRRLIEHPEVVKTAVWGSSHAECIQLGKMGLMGVNLGARAQDLFEIQYKVESLAPRLGQLKTALISMSYFSFLYDNSVSLEHRKSRDAIRIKMYALYPFHLPYIRGDAGNFIFGVLYPVLTLDHWRRVFLEAPPTLKPDRPLPSRSTKPMPIALLRKRVAVQKEKEDAISKLKFHAKRRTAGYIPLIRRMASVHPNLEQETLAAATRAVLLLKERGVRVVLFTPPYYKEYNRLFRAAWKRSMLKTTRGLAKRTGVEYYDFATDPEFESTPKLFKNSDHLNTLGAALFSAKLKERMDRGAKKVSKRQ